MNGAVASLRDLVRTYDVRPLDDAPVTPLPLLEHAEDDDELELRARMERLSYEVAAAEWRGIACTGEPAMPPERFIDGSVLSRTAAELSIGGQRRPAVLASVGALQLDLEDGRLFRRVAPTIETVLCLLSNGMPAADLAAFSEAVAPLGIEFVAAQSEAPIADFEVLRRRTWDLAKGRMEERERDLLLADHLTPAVVDGLLERRLTTVKSQGMSVLGVVKRQLRQYLPDSHVNFMYGLRPCERTPAFLLVTHRASVASWYLRLSARPGIGPSGGLVRLAVPQQWLEAHFPQPKARANELSALSHFVYRLRHRETSYQRVGVSLEPIVRVEDELHALLPPIHMQVARFHHALAV